MKLILGKRIKYYTKEIFKITNIIAIGLMIVVTMILIKYKPVYKVTIGGKESGYIENKMEFESKVNDILVEKEDVTVAFVTIDEMPEYELQFIANNTSTDEEKLVNSIKESAKIRYTMYAIMVEDNPKAYVNTQEEAEGVINEIKKDYEEESNLNIGFKQIYSDEKPETITKEIAIAKMEDENINVLQASKQKDSAIAVVNGVKIANKPITGTITSRYAAVSRIRSGAHTGLDIAASSGTPILACSAGTITFSGNSGSYGNLIKISHKNNVETWYAHCSKLFVKKGEEISAGEKIAAVGSTGNSTGPHLHLEIRINGNPTNPQKYLYK